MGGAPEGEGEPAGVGVTPAKTGEIILTDGETTLTLPAEDVAIAYVPDPTGDAFTSYLREAVRGQWSQRITVSAFTLDDFYEAIKSLEEGPKYIPVRVPAGLGIKAIAEAIAGYESGLVNFYGYGSSRCPQAVRLRTLPHRIGPRGARKLRGAR